MKRLTLIFAAALLMIQCQSASDLTIVEPLKFKRIKSVKAMAEVVDELSVVELKSPEGMRIGMVFKIIKLRDGGFAMSINEKDKMVLLFNAAGEYVCEVTATGYADGEFRAVNDIATDYVSNRLYVMDALNKVLVYDATTGQFIERIKPVWSDGTYRLDGLVPLSRNAGFSVVSSNTNTRRSEEKRKVITTFSIDGDEIAQYLETDDFMIDKSLVSQSYDNGYVLRAFDSLNTIYGFELGAPLRLYNIDFGRHAAPAYSAFNERGVLKFIPYFSNKYYKFVNNVTLTPSTMSFIASGPEGSSAHYIYDRESGRGVRFAARDNTTFPSPFYLADSEFHYMLLDKRTTDEMEERADVLLRYVVSELGVLQADEGYKLVGVKFKTL